MARLAQIDGGVVVNVIVAAPDFTIEGYTLVETAVAGPGWTYADGVFSPPPPVAVVAPVPASVTPRQLRLALLELDLLATAEAVVAGEDEATQIAWEYAVQFDRADPHWEPLAAGLGKTADDIDDLFRLAATK